MAIKVGKINGPITFWEDRDFSVIEADFLSDGVVNARGTNDDLKVVQRGAGANMSVDVNTGAAYIQITKLGKTWRVKFENLSTVNVPIASNSSGSNRVDAIIARVDVDVDPDASASNIGTIERIAGTGTSPLSDGAIQAAISSDAFIRLANVTVADSATSIVTANIADTRSNVQIGISAGGYKTKFVGDGSLLTGITPDWSQPVTANLLPDTDNLRNLGSALKNFKDAYFKKIYINNLELTGPKFGGTGTDGALTLANSAGTGTISTSGTTVTGTGTSFTTEFAVGDRIVVGSQVKVIATITSNTIMTVTQSFSPDVSGQSFSIGKTTVISCGGANLLVKNYTSISITGQAALAFSNPAGDGTVVILKSQGNVTITSAFNPAIDLRLMGAAQNTDGFGLAGRTRTGKSGSPYNIGYTYINNGAGGLGPRHTNSIYSKAITVGSGAGGNSGGLTGGRGGGGLYIECGGALDFGTSAVINASGENASQTGSGQTTIAPGGGGAGNVIIVTTSITANNGTITCNAGAGHPYNSQNYSNNNGSSGAGGGASPNNDGGNGGAGGINSSGAGGDGGSAVGSVFLNTEF